MNDPMSAYEQCPYCGEYTDGSCCLVNFDLIDKMIDEIDTYLTWHGLENRQRTALTNAANSLSIFRSITHRPNH